MSSWAPVLRRPKKFFANRSTTVKVLICDSVSKDTIKTMEDKGLQVDVKTGQTEEQLCQIIGDYEAAVVRSSTKITAKVIDAGKKLKVVARGGVGLDNIDVKYAEQKGIKVVNTPEAATNSVAELAVGLMLTAARFIPQADASMKAGQWEKKKFEGFEVSGKTLGLIGAGRIGAMTGEKAIALGMKVVAFDPFIQKHQNPRIKMVSMDELLKESDHISLHIPYDKAKGPTITKNEFAKMKKGVILVNCARGGTVCEEGLLMALNEGIVAVAAVDVWAKEPTENRTLASHERVIALPHLGASTHEGQARVGGAVAQRVIDALGV
jgi:D-3-phosphoglycerate dehydrogenase